MRGWESISLVDGWLPVLMWIVGIAGALFLLLPRRRRRWWLVIPLLLVAAVLITWGSYRLLVYVWFVFSEALPFTVLAGVTAAVFAILLGIRGLRRAGWSWRAGAAMATIAVVAWSGLQINAYFGQYTTVGGLLGEQTQVRALPAGLRRGAESHNAANAGSGAGLPSHGTVAQAPIPGPASGFNARDAIIYLPPAYTPTGADRLPVLVLVAGQPGGPQRWLDAGHLASIMDSFAAAHRGRSPVVVVADPNGSTAGNTMCMDSHLARADTYLSVDVPAWISRTLNVTSPSTGWSFGGFSFGGTCAIQMGTTHPQLYPDLIDIAGQREPALSVSRQQTIAASFGGDTAAFTSRLPLTLLKEHTYPTTHAYFAVGANDRHYGPDQAVVLAAARAAGMHVQALRVPGAGHSWATARAGLAGGLEYLAPIWKMAK
ncbi:alpha/beta hydrolase [Arthrobacter sp.]|uniref:alpha/beta hydrolase n=1 Tax=Arthrobacter sp. TaxID=1667 RepID=UPI003A91B8A6